MKPKESCSSNSKRSETNRTYLFRVRARYRGWTPTKSGPTVETQAPIKAGGNELVRSDGFRWLAQAGFAARGIVYVIIGILAIKPAIGSAGTNASQQGALRARSPRSRSGSFC